MRHGYHKTIAVLISSPNTYSPPSQISCQGEHNGHAGLRVERLRRT